MVAQLYPLYFEELTRFLTGLLKSRAAAEDVAQAVAFLADAPYITGEVLRVDGGIAM